MNRNRPRPERTHPAPTDADVARLVGAIISFGRQKKPTCIPFASDVAERLSLSLEELAPIVDLAVRQGTLVVYDDPTGFHALFLTPLGAHRFNVGLRNDAIGWVTQREATWRVPPAPGTRGHRDAALYYLISRSGNRFPPLPLDYEGEQFPVMLDCDHFEPHHVAIVAEEIARIERYLRRDPTIRPSTTIGTARRFLGTDIPWPPKQVNGLEPGDCPVCFGIDLKHNEYCSWCDRSGADWVIERVYGSATT